MEFYNLIENGICLAEIVEFGNGSLAVYWVEKPYEKLILLNNLAEFCSLYLFGKRELIHEGVKDIDEEKEDN